MRSSAQQQNNVIHMMASLDRERPVRGGNNSNNGNLPASPNNKDSSSGSEGSVWPKFAVALTNKEKEEDFLVFKGSRPPHRPKKRTKVIQKTINVCFPPSPLIVLTLLNLLSVSLIVQLNCSMYYVDTFHVKTLLHLMPYFL